MKIERASVTLVLTFGLWMVLVIGCSLPSRSENSSTNSNRRSNPNTITYHNSNEQFTGQLADNYVDFTFDYPNSWQRNREYENFVRVEKATSNGDTIEIFEVVSLADPREMLPKSAGHLNDDLSHRYSDYKKVSEGKVRIGSYDGYEFRFTAHVKAANGFMEKDIWGRIVLLPGTESRKGATLFMLASSASPDVHGPEDVGEKGELPGILDSFRFAK
jgi:hypothetical protein